MSAESKGGFVADIQMRTRWISVALLALGAAASPRAPADPAAATDAVQSGGLQEIVVTARKREESSQKVPEAVNTINAQQIEQTFQTTGLGLEGASPNLVFDKVVAAPGAAALSIRGISFQDLEKSFDPAVGVVLDGIYLGTNTGQIFQVFDFDRVEILRGPQGTLFGKNTIGGAINIVRTEPSGGWGADMRVQAGDYNLLNFDGVFNAPIVQDVLAAKVFLTSRHQQSPVFNEYTQTYPEGTVYKSYGATLKFTPIDKVKVLYTYEREEDNSPIGSNVNVSLPTDLLCFLLQQCARNATGTIPQTGSLLLADQNFPNTQFYYLDAQTLNAQYEFLPGSTLTYLFGLRKDAESTSEDFDASPVDLYETVRAQHYFQESDEFRYTYDQGGIFNLVAGLYFWKANYTLHQNTLLFIPNAVVQDTHQDSGSQAVFAQGDLQFVKDWYFTLGGRYTEEKKRLGSEQVYISPTFGANFDTFPDEPRDTWKKFTPKAGLRWQFTPEQMTYLSYSTGFRSGGFNGRGATLAAVTTPYNPETVDTFELGYKSQWLDDHLRFNADVFTSKYKNKQESIVEPVGGFQQTLVINASQATISGVELELVAVPVTGWTLSVDGGYLDAHYDSFCANVNGPTPGDTAPGQCGPAQAVSGGYLVPTDNKSQVLSRAPKYTFSLVSNYDFNLGPGIATVNGSARYKSEYYTAFQNVPLDLTPSRTIYDASLSYGLDNWRFSIFGHNLSNKVVQNGALLVAGLFSFENPTDPREWGAEIRVKFGKTR
jgi:iron complex outermembrane receptor protein